MTEKNKNTEQAMEYLKSYEIFEECGLKFDSGTIALINPVPYDRIEEARDAADRFDDIFDVILVVKTAPPPPKQWDAVELYEALDEIAKQVIDGAVGQTVIDAWTREAWVHLQDHWLFPEMLTQILDDHIEYIQDRRDAYAEILAADE